MTDKLIFAALAILLIISVVGCTRKNMIEDNVTVMITGHKVRVYNDNIVVWRATKGGLRK